MIIFSESFHYFFCWNNLSHNKRCSILRSILTRYVIRLRKLLHPSHLFCITFLQIWKILNSSFSKIATKRYVKVDWFDFSYAQTCFSLLFRKYVTKIRHQHPYSKLKPEASLMLDTLVAKKLVQVGNCFKWFFSSTISAIQI